LLGKVLADCKIFLIEVIAMQGQLGQLYFPNNRRLLPGEAENLFRKEKTEEELRAAVEMLKKYCPSQA
jgi:hypothetical protein